MTTLFQNFFKKKQLNRVTKDFPEMPSIDGPRDFNGKRGFV